MAAALVALACSISSIARRLHVCAHVSASPVGWRVLVHNQASPEVNQRKTDKTSKSSKGNSQHYDYRRAPALEEDDQD